MLTFLGFWGYFYKSTKKSWHRSDPLPPFGNAKIFTAPSSPTPPLCWFLESLHSDTFTMSFGSSGTVPNFCKMLVDGDEDESGGQYFWRLATQILGKIVIVRKLCSAEATCRLLPFLFIAPRWQ